MTDPILSLRGVSKVYPGVRALDDVSIDFIPGEVHGVVGENGAGKSTLIQLIAGGVVPDEGWIELAGQRDVYSTPSAARAGGIAVVFQEFQSLMGVSVTENVLLGSRWGRRGVVGWRTAHRQAELALEEVGLEIDVRNPMESLNPAQRKLVEIARAVHSHAQVILLDEPTAALELEDSARVLAAMERLRETGCALVFVSHRLQEVLEICDRVTVLRDGRHTGCWPAAELSTGRLAELMIGRDLDADVAAHVAPRERAVLEVSRLVVEPVVHGLDLTVHEGEVVGLAGVIGSGRSEIGQALFGLLKTQAGTIQIDGEPVHLSSPAKAVDAHIAYVPSDRQRDGMVFTLDIKRNLSLGVLRRLSRWGVIRRKDELGVADTYFDRMRVRATGLAQAPETLSGGNQQKVLVGRWLATNPKLLILDEPTQGIDIGAKAEIHALISELAAEGLAVLIISSDLPELLSMSDRVEVLHRGEITRSFPRGTADEAQVMLAASGEPSAVAA
jgi:ABC-type sugar transport system ATPase subunit